MGVPTLAQIERRRDELLAVARRHGAVNIAVFGSVARGEARPDSDVDFLVDLEQGRSLFDLVALVQDWSDVLGRRADVVTRRALHWFLRERVLAEAVPL